MTQGFPKAMKWLSFTSLSLIYTVMLLGVYITSSHQGLSCPEWPLCPNGLNLPPSEYLFEHVHRMLVVIASGFIFATAIYSSKKAKNVRKPSIIAAIIVIIQIFIGMFVVNSKLEALLVASHLATGILLFAMLLMTFIFSYKEEKNFISTK
ncbi:MAG: COX15/CtaA family protein [Nitrososphaeraceae archaeon]